MFIESAVAWDPTVTFLSQELPGFLYVSVLTQINPLFFDVFLPSPARHTIILFIISNAVLSK